MVAKLAHARDTIVFSISFYFGFILLLLIFNRTKVKETYNLEFST